jgi:hypothetical protein
VLVCLATASAWLLQDAESALAPLYARWGPWVIALTLVAFIVLLSVPFLPGVDLGWALMMIAGPPGIALVFGAALIGLSLSFLVGRRIPLPVVARALEWLRFHRAAAWVSRLTPLPPQARYPPMPSLVFTVPALASVGLNEAEAAAQGLKFSTRFEETGDWYSTRRLGESLSAYNVLVENGTDRILGAHLLGPNAEEAINVFTLAIKAGFTASDIKETIFGYPTFSSDVGYMV